jgi:hypothetical protein
MIEEPAGYVGITALEQQKAARMMCFVRVEIAQDIVVASRP